MNKRVIWLLLSCITTLVMLSSCGGGAKTTAPATSAAPAKTTAAPTTAAATTPAKTTAAASPTLPSNMTKVTLKKLDGTTVEKTLEKPKYGGNLNYVVPSSPVSFDEAIVQTPRQFPQFLVFDELLDGDWTKGPVGTGENSYMSAGGFQLKFTVPELAESWEVPASGTIIYHIRKGVHFALDPNSEASKLVNGRELNAKDVAYTINRMYTVKTSHLLAGAPSGTKAEATATDNWTVTVKCPAQYTGQFLEDTGDKCQIVCPEVIDKYGDMKDWKNLVGTGPYTLKEYIPDNSLTFVKNPTYWRKDPLFPENTTPYLDSVKYYIIGDLATALASFRTAKIDVIDSQMIVRREDGQNLLKSIPELKSTKAPEPSTLMLSYRVDKAGLPYQDIRVRKAINMAVDLKSIVRDFYGGEATMMSYPVAPFPEFSDLIVPLEKLPADVQEIFTYNPDKAKQLLKDAGYPTGFKEECFVAKEQVDQAQILKEYLGKVGIDITLNVKELAQFQSVFNTRAYNMCLNTGGNALPFQFWRYRPSSFNGSMVDDKKITDIFNDLSAHYFDDAYRKKVYTEQLTPYALGQAWYVYFPAPYLYTIWWPWVKEYEGAFSVGYADRVDFFKYCWTDQDLKKSMGK